MSPADAKWALYTAHQNLDRLRKKIASNTAAVAAQGADALPPQVSRSIPAMRRHVAEIEAEIAVLAPIAALYQYEARTSHVTFAPLTSYPEGCAPAPLDIGEIPDFLRRIA